MEKKEEKPSLFGATVAMVVILFSLTLFGLILNHRLHDDHSHHRQSAGASTSTGTRATQSKGKPAKNLPSHIEERGGSRVALRGMEVNIQTEGGPGLASGSDAAKPLPKCAAPEFDVAKVITRVTALTDIPNVGTTGDDDDAVGTTQIGRCMTVCYPTPQPAYLPFEYLPEYQVQHFTRPAAGMTLDEDSRRPPRVLDEAMKFLTTHLLRNPKPEWASENFKKFEYLWNRFRQVRQDWSAQGDTSHRKKKWLEFMVRVFALRIPACSRNATDFNTFIETKKNNSESIKDTLSQLAPFYRAENKRRNNEMVAAALLFHGLQLNSKIESYAAWLRCTKRTDPRTGEELLEMEPYHHSVDLFDVYQELASVPCAAESVVVKQVLSMLHALHAGRWFHFLRLIVSYDLPFIIRCFLSAVISYVRYRAVMDLIVSRRFRGWIAVSTLTKHLLFCSEQDCVAFLELIGLVPDKEEIGEGAATSDGQNLKEGDSSSSVAPDGPLPSLEELIGQQKQQGKNSFRLVLRVTTPEGKPLFSASDISDLLRTVEKAKYRFGFPVHPSFFDWHTAAARAMAKHSGYDLETIRPEQLQEILSTITDETVAAADCPLDYMYYLDAHYPPALTYAYVAAQQGSPELKAQERPEEDEGDATATAAAVGAPTYSPLPERLSYAPALPPAGLDDYAFADVTDTSSGDEMSDGGGFYGAGGGGQIGEWVPPEGAELVENEDGSAPTFEDYLGTLLGSAAEAIDSLQCSDLYAKKTVELQERERKRWIAAKEKEIAKQLFPLALKQHGAIGSEERQGLVALVGLEREQRRKVQSAKKVPPPAAAPPLPAPVPKVVPVAPTAALAKAGVAVPPPPTTIKSTVGVTAKSSLVARGEPEPEKVSTVPPGQFQPTPAPVPLPPTTAASIAKKEILGKEQQLPPVPSLPIAPLAVPAPEPSQSLAFALGESTKPALPSVSVSALLAERKAQAPAPPPAPSLLLSEPGRDILLQQKPVEPTFLEPAVQQPPEEERKKEALLEPKKAKEPVLSIAQRRAKLYATAAAQREMRVQMAAQRNRDRTIHLERVTEGQGEGETEEETIVEEGGEEPEMLLQLPPQSLEAIPWEKQGLRFAALWFINVAPEQQAFLIASQQRLEQTSDPGDQHQRLADSMAGLKPPPDPVLLRRRQQLQRSSFIDQSVYFGRPSTYDRERDAALDSHFGTPTNVFGMPLTGGPRLSYGERPSPPITTLQTNVLLFGDLFQCPATVSNTSKAIAKMLADPSQELVFDPYYHQQRYHNSNSSKRSSVGFAPRSIMVLKEVGKEFTYDNCSTGKMQVVNSHIQLLAVDHGAASRVQCDSRPFFNSFAIVVIEKATPQHAFETLRTLKANNKKRRGNVTIGYLVIVEDVADGELYRMTQQLLEGYSRSIPFVMLPLITVMQSQGTQLHRTKTSTTTTLCDDGSTTGFDGRTNTTVSGRTTDGTRKRSRLGRTVGRPQRTRRDDVRRTVGESLDQLFEYCFAKHRMVVEHGMPF